MNTYPDDIQATLQRFHTTFKDDIGDADKEWAMLWVKVPVIEEFIARECLALKKKWEREHFDNQ